MAEVGFHYGVGRAWVWHRKGRHHSTRVCIYPACKNNSGFGFRHLFTTYRANGGIVFYGVGASIGAVLLGALRSSDESSYRFAI